MNADPVSALSATGSAILPKSVTSPRRLASLPSSRSVSEAMANSTNAATRQRGPPMARNRTKNGTRISRSTVSPLATLRTPGRPADGGPADEAPSGELKALPCAVWAGKIPYGTFLAGKIPYGRHGRDGVGHQVRALGRGEGGPHQVAGPPAGAVPDDGRPVHLGRLVGRPALVAAGGQPAFQQHVADLADAVGGALRHQL